MRKYVQRCGFAAIAIILPLLGAIAGAGESAPERGYSSGDSLYQLAPTAVLARGLYEGTTPFRALLQLGGFGLGALNPIDGEIIIVDGLVYHASHRGGQLREVGPGEKTPFAYIKRFREDRRIALPAARTLAELTREIDRRLPTPNLIYALRIEGTFDYLKLRSVPSQKPPYPPIDEVVESQSVYELNDTAGTIVALRFPPYLGDVTGSGFHMHFVDAQRQVGGHVLDLRIPALSVPVDESRSLTMVLPDGRAFEEEDFSGTADASGVYERAVRGDAAND